MSKHKTPVENGPAQPRHVAIIMDGNGRWAKKRGMPRTLGHSNGAGRVRTIVQHCADLGIEHVTLFAFSSENWKRPPEEVSALMGLFILYLQKEIKQMNFKGVRLRIIGNKQRFDAKLQKLFAEAEAETAHNTQINMTVAVNYGGRWDIVQAMQGWQAAHPGQSAECLTEEALKPFLSMSYAPDPDLLIRTGGEARISNFLLWQLAYAEVFFTDVLWPDFSVDELQRALSWYAAKDRRFGAVTELVAS